jgi:hypothetical protein
MNKRKRKRRKNLTTNPREFDTVDYIRRAEHLGGLAYGLWSNMADDMDRKPPRRAVFKIETDS